MDLYNGKTTVSFVARNYWLLFTALEIKDSLKSSYFVWKDGDWQMSRNGKVVYECGLHQELYMYGEKVKYYANNYDFGSYTFNSSEGKVQLECPVFYRGQRINKGQIKLDKEVIALIERKSNLFETLVEYNLEIESTNTEVIDMVLFIVMHDYNFDMLDPG